MPSRVLPRHIEKELGLGPRFPIENRFLVDEGTLTDAVSTGGANLQFRQVAP